jgi:CheY-like chemotaxis protein
MILFVDDTGDSREVVCKILRSRGYPCHAVADGPEALACIRAHPPEQPLLVVLDSMMPGMSGIDVLKAIRADSKIADTHVVMFSAGFNLAHRDEAITLRASAWLYKGTDQAFDEICRCYERVGGVAILARRGDDARSDRSIRQ